MPTKADEARARLAEHVDYLRGQIRSMELLRPGLSTERLEFIAAAIERYLSREAKTLDEAFSLAQPAHRPPAHVEMVARAIPLRERAKPMPWKQIIHEVGYRGGGKARDELALADQFKKLYGERYEEAVILHLGTWISDGMGD